MSSYFNECIRFEFYSIRNERSNKRWHMSVCVQNSVCIELMVTTVFIAYWVHCIGIHKCATEPTEMNGQFKLNTNELQHESSGFIAM